MPWLPLYSSESDFEWLFSHLCDDEEIAFLVTSSARSWIAKSSISFRGDGRYCLWHVPSGQLPLLRERGKDSGVIIDPWQGWAEERAGADPSIPYFGPGHSGIIWLNACSKSKTKEDCLGMSSFEWIGNHYRILGNAAPEVTQRYWKNLGRAIKKVATRIPRSGPWDGEHPEIWALPNALKRIQNGTGRNANP